MQDNAALEISALLHQLIEDIVGEVILEGKSFEDHEKYLSRYCEAEGVDYHLLRKSLMSLFATAEEMKNHDASLEPTGQSDISGWPLEFLEHLRSAYCRKDTAFIENVLSPDSQIITGAYVRGKGIRYRTQGKQQYLANLQYIFAKNDKIEVEFDEDNLTGVLYKSANERCQIVRLLQHWSSDKHSDDGYLSFLLCSNPDGIKVLLRAWQPLNK